MPFSGTHSTPGTTLQLPPGATLPVVKSAAAQRLNPRAYSPVRVPGIEIADSGDCDQRIQ